MSCFPDSSLFLQPYVGTSALEEAVDSSRLYGLASVKKELRLVVVRRCYAGDTVMSGLAVQVPMLEGMLCLWSPGVSCLSR